MSAGTKRILTEATGIKLLRALEIINDGSATTSAATTADESRILTDATGDALVDELDDLLTTLKGNLGSTRNGVAVTVEGNKASVNVTSGQYVIVQNSTISGITDGAYKATANVTAGTAFTSGNLTAVSGGVANSLNDQIANIGLWYDSGSYSKAVVAETLTVVKEITLAAGSWVITSLMDLTTGSSGVYLHGLTVNSKTNAVRSPCANGGGSSVSDCIHSDSTITVQIQAYVDYATTIRGRISAMRVK